MMKTLLSAAVMLCATMLAGCSMLSKPSADHLRHCVVDPRGGGTSTPLSAVLELLKQRGSTIGWGARDGLSVLRVGSTNPYTGQPTEIIFEIEFREGAEAGQYCGPGQAIIQQGTINGEAFTPSNLIMLIHSMAADAYKQLAAAAPADQAPAAMAPPLAAPAAEAEDNGMDAELEADAAHRAEQAKLAAQRPLSLVDSQGKHHFGWTVQRLVDRFRSTGAQVGLETADEGTVWITITDPAGRWNGWKLVELTLIPTPAMPNGLIITTITADDQIVAALQGDNPTPEDVLKDVLPLR